MRITPLASSAAAAAALSLTLTLPAIGHDVEEGRGSQLGSVVERKLAGFGE